MKRSVLFFTFVLGLMGCGSDADESARLDEQRNPSDPVVAPARPPASDDVNDVARIDDGSDDPNAAFALKPFAQRSFLESPSAERCTSLPVCTERGIQRHAAQP
jgi:hypothetical protein